jgi:hypothetical protein
MSMHFWCERPSPLDQSSASINANACDRRDPAAIITSGGDDGADDASGAACDSRRGEDRNAS